MRTQLERGAVAPLIAILLPLLLLAAALAVDIGMLLSAKSQLQRAVDAAALSAAQAVGEIQDTATAQTTARRYARQVLGANGVRLSELAQPVDVSFPPDKGNAVTVVARLRSPSYLLRAVSPITEFTVAASATADVNSYAEVPIKPSGNFGKIQQLNPAIFGPAAWRSRGDVYSAAQTCSNEGAGSGCSANPFGDDLPYGYLFRIDVPPSYSNEYLSIELFDPDTYNNPATISGCSGQHEDTCIIQDVYGVGWHHFERVDELRGAVGMSGNNCNDAGPGGGNPGCSTLATTTEFTLWHFDPLITNPFLNPSLLSDVSTGTYVTGQRYIARASYGYTAATDLRWVAPAGFQVRLSDFAVERDGSRFFYIYARSTAGSSENNFDIRTGPPGQIAAGEHVWTQHEADHAWESGGSAIYAKRAYPMNNAGVATSLTVYLTQVPANAAGQTLQVRHFDNDCSSNCGLEFYLEDPSGNLVTVATGQVSGNNTWGQTDSVLIPERGTPAYSQVFPPGTESAWLRLRYPPTIAQDTSVWELIYVRPRLIR